MFRQAVNAITCFTENQSGVNLSVVISSKWPELKVNIVLKNNGKNLRLSSLMKNEKYDSSDINEMITARKDKNLFFSTDEVACIKESNIIFLIPDCKLKKYGYGNGEVLDFSMIGEVVTKIAKNSDSSKVVVDGSVVSLRTSEFMNSILQCHSRPEIRFEVLSNPDIFQFNYIRHILKPYRILIGYNNSPDAIDAVSLLSNIYKRWVPPESICTCSINILEVSQITIYSFIAQRIANMRVISIMSKATESDLKEISSFLNLNADMEKVQPFSSYGEEHFSKIISVLCYLCKINGLHEVANYWRQTIFIEELYKKNFLAQLISTVRDEVPGKMVTLLGFPRSSDSFAVDVAIGLLDNEISLSIYEMEVEEEEVFDILCQAGYCTTNLFNNSVVLHQNILKACSTSNVLVFTRGWFQFSSVDFEKVFSAMAKPAYVFDFGVYFPVSKFLDLGFHVYSMGTLESPKIVESKPVE